MGYLEDTILEYEAYVPPLTKEDDFDVFWERTIAVAKSNPLNPLLEEIDYPIVGVRVFSITYNGFDDTRVHGWYIVPSFLKKDIYPCLINFHGFTGSRGYPHDYLHWAMMGLAVIAIDCRDQGGLTGNSAAYTSGSGQILNVNSKGILDKDEYYYRAVYMDCLKAIDFAETCAEVDNERIILNGLSQGGALSVAVSALDDRPKIIMVDVPSNSNITERVNRKFGSYSSVTEYLKRYPQHLEQAYKTLSYFDTMNMADRIQSQVFASVSLSDVICPAKYFYATYNRIKSEKEITVYPFNGHDDCPLVHLEKKLQFLRNNDIMKTD